MLVLVLLVTVQTAYAGEQITLAVAADMKFAMDEIVALFGRSHPGGLVDTVYGSSGKFQTQIRQGAPYDVYFSADSAYPIALQKEGFVAGEVRPYALGRIVLWSQSHKLNRLSDLADPAIRRIAIANPKHAPYGKCAEEALRAAGIWDKVRDRMVYGEDIAQTAQFVQSGNADVGIIALSLAKRVALSGSGGYVLIPDTLHQPLVQAYVITRRAANNQLAQEFSRFMASPEVRVIMIRNGFALLNEAR
ncbi:MAG: molybdate ABC transporter substrate-binding protein [Gallionella sp.]